MVDFQSRDTRRDRYGTADDEGDDEGDGEDGTTASDAETPDETADPADETAADESPEGMAYALVTVGREQSLESDPAVEMAAEALEADGATVPTREGLAPEFDAVQGAVGRLVDRGDVTAVVVLGGVGVGPDDVTVEAVESLVDKRLPGFGELFRALSHEAEGTAVVRTRATAGLIDGVPVFCLPDDPAAARRGLEELVIPEAEPLIRETNRPR